MLSPPYIVQPSMNLSKEGISLSCTFNKFSGSNDISVWQYHIESLFRAIGVDYNISGTYTKPRCWSDEDFEIRCKDLDEKENMWEYRQKTYALDAEYDRRRGLVLDWRSQDSKAIAAIQHNCEPYILMNSG